jgi:two-component system LytT family response regulator
MKPPSADVEGAAPLRVVVVDDEEPARRLLRGLLASLPRVELVAECANGFEAVRVASELAPDVLLLDIQMPKLDGFEVLELLGGGGPAVVFVTAHDEHALRAFEVHAVDYLLKPVSGERLAAALGRVRGRLGSGSAAAGPPARQLITAARGPGGRLERLLVREGSAVAVIPVEKLDYVEARDDYVCLRAEGKKHVKQQTLGELEKELDPGRFVRIHRSYLLNVERLARIELYAKDSRVAILADGTRLPVSRAGYARLQELW